MDKNSIIADAVGNLYRGALYLARDDLDKKLGQRFIKKAVGKLKESQEYLQEANDIEIIFNKHKDSDLILAEKILDKYNSLRLQMA